MKIHRGMSENEKLNILISIVKFCDNFIYGIS